MGPLQATTKGFQNSLAFSGRTSRAEFWGFAPAGATLPVVTAVFLPPTITNLRTLIGKLLVVGLTCLPLTAAATRRFQDTGLSGGDLWQGLKPTVAVIVSGWILLLGLFGIVTIVYAEWGVIFFLGALFPFLIYIFVAPGTLGTTIGQLLLPSQPGPNKYGPNPNEVIQ